MRLVTLLGTVAAALLLVANPALAEEVAGQAASTGGFSGLAAGLGIAIAAFGGALGQGRTASAALEGIGRNPGASGQMFTPFILAMVLIESLVIYALVISAKLAGLF